jgi:hypothetical protein
MTADEMEATYICAYTLLVIAFVVGTYKLKLEDNSASFWDEGLVAWNPQFDREETIALRQESEIAFAQAKKKGLPHWMVLWHIHKSGEMS